MALYSREDLSWPMKRLALSLLIALPISAVVTVLLFLASVFAGGACHCMTPVSIFFPYGRSLRCALVGRPPVDTRPSFNFRFMPLIAGINGWRKRLTVSFVVLIVHSIAAIGAVTMYQWWK